MDLDRDGAAKPEKAEEPIVLSLSEVAAKIDPLGLAKCIGAGNVPDMYVFRFYAYLNSAFKVVSLPWVKMFKESPLSALIDAGHFAVLAMILRARPDSLVKCLPSQWDKHMDQEPDKLPLIVWMMAQASLGDLSAGLYSWMCNLLRDVSNNKCCPQSLDLVLQFAEYMLSCPKALTILVNGGGVMEGQRLVPLPSLEILLRLTFPAPSARVETTKRFEAIYPSLKEVALSPERAGGGTFAMKQLFAVALTLTGEKGNPVVLTNEATSIAIRCLSANVFCFDHWDKIYVDNPEVSVALLKKLVDDNHFLRLSTPPIDTLTVNQIMESFRRKNKRAIAEGGASCSLYKEADKYCTRISWRLFWRLPLASPMTAGVVTVASAALSVAAVAASFYLHT